MSRAFSAIEYEYHNGIDITIFLQYISPKIRLRNGIDRDMIKMECEVNQNILNSRKAACPEWVGSFNHRLQRNNIKK